MNQTSPSPLNTAISAAKKAGQMLRDNFGKDQDVDEKKDFDIKLRLDVLCQEAIEKIIFKNHPDHALYGEEGTAGNQDSELRWVVDPIDGTVNYYYGIPHFCISIALQNKGITKLSMVSPLPSAPETAYGRASLP